MSKFGKGICAHCGKEFDKKSGVHIYCSDDCRRGDQRKIRDRVDAKIHEGGEDVCCLWCGKWFKRPYKSRKQYCRPECQYKAMTATEKEKRAKRRPRRSAKVEVRDGFTWDEIRAVFSEYGISSYHKALEILAQRRNEAIEMGRETEL